MKGNTEHIHAYIDRDVVFALMFFSFFLFWSCYNRSLLEVRKHVPISGALLVFNSLISPGELVEQFGQ